MELKYYVDKNNKYKNINEILSLEFNLSSKLQSRLIRNEKIYKNNNVVDTRNDISIGDTILVDLNMEEDNSNIVPTKMQLNIIYEDDWFLVLDKPSGIAVHPSYLHYDTSLSNGVKYYFDLIGLKKKIRPVNRLDFNTSGVVIFAKCEYIQEELSKQMKKGVFEKYYLALVEGILPNKKGTINLPIARKKGSIIERCIDKNGQDAITKYTVIKEFQDYSLIKLKLETGRTHQIRIHMKAIDHPILGDTLYNNPSSKINRQALHSYQIKCIHPITNGSLIFTSKLAKDMESLIK